MTWLRRVVAIAALIAAALVIWLFVLDEDVGPVDPADPQGAEVEEITIDSKAVGEELPVTVVTPEGSLERSLLVFLHGRDGDQDSSLVDPMFDALADLGGEAPIVAFPYGGASSYWHDRDDGNWGQYVVNEVIPEVAERTEADPRRVAIGGISMGGFGAFDLARLYPNRFCAAGGHSPALWTSPEETAEGAFDDAEDFARHNVVGGASNFADQTVWVDAGTEDPFIPGDDAFTDSLESYGADVTSKRWPGGHDSDYWDDRWADYLGFYAEALKDC